MDRLSDRDEGGRGFIGKYIFYNEIKTIIIPNPSKVQRDGKITHSKAMEAKGENFETPKRKKTESKGEMVEVVEVESEQK